MIIDFKNKFVFLHPKKTGGTALKAAVIGGLSSRALVFGGLEKVYATRGLFPSYNITFMKNNYYYSNNKVIDYYKLNLLSFIGKRSFVTKLNLDSKTWLRSKVEFEAAEHIGFAQANEISEFDLSGYTTISIARNPLAHAISDYSYMRRRSADSRELNMSFAEFLDRKLRMKLYDPRRSMRTNLEGPNGKLVDYVIRAESFERDIRRVFSNDLGIAIDLVPRINVDRTKFKPQFGSSEIGLVEKIYDFELSHFDYRLVL